MSSSMSARILSARAEASLTQSQLAEQLRVNRSAVAQWERVEGGTNPSIVHLTHIADITGVGFEWLATGRGIARSRRRRANSRSPTEEISNEFEVQCLQWLRRIPTRKHALVVQLLSELAHRR